MSIADEPVTIQLGDDDVKIATQYDVHLGIFDQPSSFALTLGSGEIAANIIKRYPKNSPFRIQVAGRNQYAGFTDALRASGDSGATEVSIKGWDILARLHQSFHEREASYVGATHRELIAKALEDVQLLRPFSPPGTRPSILASNANGRNVRTGAVIVAPNDDFETELLRPIGTIGNAQVVLRAKLGERWLELLQRHLRQSGLFIWCSTDGDIVVGQPNHTQAPIYRIVRARDWKRRINNVEDYVFEDSLAPRYSEVVIYGRTTGKKYARTTQKGAYSDDVLIAEGIHKVLVLRDVDVTSTAHAEFIAKRYLAEGRRAGFYLEYKMAGHTTPKFDGAPQGSFTGAGRERIVWAPDTMVQVVDEELDLAGNFWIENVRHTRSSAGTFTTLRLLPPDSLIFGEDV